MATQNGYTEFLHRIPTQNSSNNIEIQNPPSSPLPSPLPHALPFCVAPPSPLPPPLQPAHSCSSLIQYLSYEPRHACHLYIYIYMYIYTLNLHTYIYINIDFPAALTRLCRLRRLCGLWNFVAIWALGPGGARAGGPRAVHGYARVAH